MYLFTLHQLIATIGEIDCLAQIISTIQFGLICALSLSINLGKVRSYIYTGLFVICSIAKNFVLPLGISSISLSELVLMMILGIMVYAKYQDKAARGTN